MATESSRINNLDHIPTNSSDPGRTARVGLIGVGLLGTAIAERLISAGFPVVGFDTNSERCEALERIGGRTAKSTRDVTRSCHRILLSLPTTAISLNVLNEIAPFLPADAIILDTTTGSPDDSQRAADLLLPHHVAYLDTTVAGSSEVTRQGQSVLMVGGDPNAYDRCREIFAAISNRTFLLGPAGSGARMKLVVNLVLGLNRAVLAEGLSLARSCGIDLQVTLDLLKAGPAFSEVMNSKGKKMIDEDFAPQARLAQHHKDVKLILELASKHDVKVPLSQLHDDLLARATQMGFGDCDNCAIIKAFS